MTSSEPVLTDNINSPVEEIRSALFTEKQVRVFVKRDDMIHPFISGNKWRKLKYILQEAQDQQKKRLVTFGGAFSNHLLATACAAARYGFRSAGIVRGEEVVNDTLMLCRIFGMHLRFADRSSYRDKDSLFGRYYGEDPDAFFINEGGAGSNGIRGCSELVGELDETYDHIFCAGGTGTTAAGIIKGIETRSLNTRCHVIPVLKGGGFLEEEIHKYTSLPFDIHTGYHFGGYAKASPELWSFIKTFCSSTGILIEPVYTGKMFFALHDLIASDRFMPGSRILAIHTGGLTGIHGMLPGSEL